ncbi:MAG: pyridoxal phosphate-dependent aminotransferase [Acholeplasmatales bacterium]|nr:pyridoxal phosphate-dependent aminotransferase [Acholeplasmatales bacterium]
MINEKSFALGNTGSAIRELFEYGKKRKQIVGEDNVFDYSIGNPSIPSPSIVNESLIKIIKEVEPTKLHGYTSAVGDQSVREAIAKYVNETYKTEESANMIYLTCGAAASLTISLNAILNQGDEVITFAPFFPEYRVFVEKANGKLVTVESKKDDFQIDFNALEKAINKNTKAIIINSPNNPTGVVLKEKTIIDLSDFLRKKSKEFNNVIYLISDEPYRELVYDNNTVVPYVTKYYENTIVCYSFSKSISLPGERIGYILVGHNCMDKVMVYKAICGAGRALGFVCAPALFQYMIPYVLGHTSNLEVYKQNRDLLYNSLSKMGYDIIFPDGAFYLFVKALEEDAIKFAEVAKKYELLLVPSNSFGMNGYVRIAYCQDPKMIERSINAFKLLMDDYKK